MPPASHTPKAPRWHSLDLLRSLAIILMVQGHTMTALLRPDLREATWYKIHTFVHGFTAPMFLISAGLAYGFTTFRRLEKHTTFGPATKKRLKRYAQLMLIGYMFQLSWGALSVWIFRPWRFFLKAFRIGPLHLISFTLLCCEALLLILKERRRFVWACALLMFLVLGLSPMVWTQQLAAKMPPFIGTWFDNSHRSLFPIFPWAAFIFFGVLCAHFVVREDQPSSVRKHLGKASLALGCLLCALTYIPWLLELLADKHADYFWDAHPAFVIFRMGGVLIVFAACSLAQELLVKNTQTSATPKWLLMNSTLGRHALAAYVIHLFILFGSPIHPGLKYRFGKALNLGPCILACALVVLATLLLTFTWARFQKHRAQG